jgi:magnesium transporter
MSKTNKIVKKRGLSPGSLIFTGEQKVSETKITVFDYNLTNYEEVRLENLDDLSKYKENKNVSWINVSGLHDVDRLEKMSSLFNIHPLVIEDVLNVFHPSKMEEHDEFLFLITKMIDYDKEKNELNIEHVCFVLGKNYLITFQETEGDIFDLIRERIRNDKGRLRKFGPDYLMYRLLDSIVDNYMIVLHQLDERIENIEDELLDSPAQGTLESIHKLRKEIIKLKRIIFPFREVIYSMEKDIFPLIQKSTRIFLRDLYDHIKNSMDTIENYREVLNGLVETYHSGSAFRLNEIVKVLTIISTIFIPLTFIVGIYGMNFNPDISPWNLPELNSPYGYPLVLGIMIMIAVGLLFFFKKKKWL